MFACKRIVEQATRERLDTFYIMQQFCENCCIMKQLQARSRCVWGAAVCGVHENSTLFKTTVISGRLPARPITPTGRLLHTAKKKVNGLPAPVDNPHVVIQLFRWRKRDIKAIHFSLSIQTCAQFCVNISLYFID